MEPFYSKLRIMAGTEMRQRVWLDDNSVFDVPS